MSPASHVGRKTHWLLLFAAILMPIAFFLYITFLVPRPYYIMGGADGGDMEADYYYSSLLLFAGRPVAEFFHPGTPIYFLSYLLRVLSDVAFEGPQSFLSLGYFVVALITAASLCTFVYLLPKDAPIGIAALTLASIVAWPPFLAYMNHFGADSFIVALGVPTIALFWSSLENGRKPHKTSLALSGIGLGACLATKLTFLPVGAALIVASSTQILLSIRAKAENWPSLLLMPMSAIVSFLVLTAPIMDRLPNVIITTALRKDTRPADQEVLGEFLRMLHVLLQDSLPLTILMIVATAGSLYLSVRYVAHRLTASRRARTCQVMDGGGFDYVSGGAFLVLMMVGFVYTMAASAHKLEGPAFPGTMFRNVSPSALFVPFLILYCYRLCRATGMATSLEAPRLRVLGGIAGLVIVTWAVMVHVERRYAFIQHETARIASTLERLEALAQPATRIAFWDGSPGGALGEVSFHFWGNYRYAKDYFDQQLIETYPKYTFLRLREIDRIVREQYGGLQALSSVNKTEHDWRHSPFLGWRSLIRNIYRALLKIFPRLYIKRTNEIVTGESSGVKVSLIAFPDKEGIAELRKTGLSEFLSLIEAQFGAAKVWKESIGGVEWVLIAVSGVQLGQRHIR